MRCVAFLVAGLALAAVGEGRARAQATDDGARARDEYQRIVRSFSSLPRERFLGELDRYIDGVAAAGRPERAEACIWRAQLALVDGDLGTAERRNAEATQPASTADAGVLALALRGLGDVAFRRGRLDDAEADYRQAWLKARDPALRAELDAKLAMVQSERSRRHRGWLAAGVYLGCVAFFAVAVARRRPLHLRWPPEALYAMPVILLLVAGSRFSDQRVTPALAWCGAGALGLITLSGLSAGHRHALHLGVLLVGVAATLYFSACQGGILDLLEQTFHTLPVD